MASMQVKTIIFEKGLFSRAGAMKWVRDHNFSASGVVEKEDSFEIRQPDSEGVLEVQTIRLTEGVNAVVGKADSPIEKISPEAIAKALYPGVDPVKLRAQLIEDNDGFIGGTIRYGSSAGSEFGSEYDDEGVKRNVGGPNERFSFGDLTFDVDAAKEICDGEVNQQLEVSDLWSVKINVDHAAAMRSTSSKPVLVAQIPTKKGLIPLLIDGHHRMYRAHQEGEELIDAYILTPEESLFIIDTHPDMMTTLAKNLRDILDPPDVKTDEQFLDRVAKVWRKILEKAQPGGGDVHVPSAGSEDDDDAPRAPADPGEQTPGGQTTGSQNEDVGINQPDFSNKVPKYRAKRAAAARRFSKSSLERLYLKEDAARIEKAQSGVMICLYIPGEIGERIAVPGGEPVEDLHVTLAYLPGVGEDRVVYESICRLMADVAKQFAPVGGSIGGIGVFNPSPSSDGKQVYYASFNSPVLPSVLGAVRNAMDWGGVTYAMNHGFTPHITLKYQDPGEPVSVGVRSEAFRVPAISVASRALGRSDILFSGTRVQKEDEEDEEEAEDEVPARYSGTDGQPQARDYTPAAIGKEGRPIFKADAKKQIVYCVVLEPHTEDAQEDVMTPEDIEEAAHKYMEKARRIGRRHKSIIEKAFPVESYIAPMDMQFSGGPYGDSTVTKGSWVIGIKVLDRAEWAKVESGEYQGVSVGGMGVRI